MYNCKSDNVYGGRKRKYKGGVRSEDDGKWGDEWDDGEWDDAKWSWKR